MVEREALRNFQSRLADRLQAARDEGLPVSWLAVESGGGRYLFALAQAGEIFPWTPPQALPYTQPWFLGVASLRGGLHGVVDLAAFLRGQAPVARLEASLIALNPAFEVNCALRVDRLVGLRGAAAFTSAQAASEGAAPYLGGQYTDTDGVHWRELDLQALARHPAFLNVRA